MESCNHRIGVLVILLAMSLFAVYNESGALVMIDSLMTAEFPTEFFVSELLPSNITIASFEHDFSYDRQAWNNSPRVAILAGPHKAASTTLQEFVSFLARQTVIVSNASMIDTPRLGRSIRDKRYIPHPSNQEWVWPVGIREEYSGKDSLAGGLDVLSTRKFYATLASLVTTRRESWKIGLTSNLTDSEYQNKRTQAETYFRRLLEIPLQEGKKLVIASEEFDSVIMDIGKMQPKKDAFGEAIHVFPPAVARIDNLLRVLPWKVGTKPLKMEEIEIHMNYRLPRISHANSIWHELGHGSTFRGFLRQSHDLYQMNTLAQALQFVRKGFKVSIVDMSGVFEKEDKESNHEFSNNGTSVVGGIQGVVACEILRMGQSPPLVCDERSKLYLPDYETKPKNSKNLNAKSDKNAVHLDDEQLKDLDTLFEAYDCGVWQHLQKYQAQGLLRILHPSERLFSRCDPSGSPDISWKAVLEQTAEIAERENGIPILTWDEQMQMRKERKKEEVIEKGKKKYEREKRKEDRKEKRKQQRKEKIKEKRKQQQTEK